MRNNRIDHETPGAKANRLFNEGFARSMNTPSAKMSREWFNEACKYRRNLEKALNDLIELTGVHINNDFDSPAIGIPNLYCHADAPLTRIDGSSYPELFNYLSDKQANQNV